jgi:uncharacterized membrane protein
MLELLAFIGGFIIAVIAYFIIMNIYTGVNGIVPLSNDGMAPYMFSQHISQPFTGY